MQSNQHHASVIYLLCVFVLVSFGLVTILYSYQQNLLQHVDAQTSASLRDMPIDGFAYYKGGYKTFKPNVTIGSGVCTLSDNQLQQVIDVLSQQRGNLFFRQFVPFYEDADNNIVYGDTTLQLTGKFNIEMYAGCTIEKGTFNDTFLRVDEKNGTVQALRCYLIVKNWIHNDIEGWRNLVKRGLLEAKNGALELKDFHNLNTMALVYSNDVRPNFYGVIRGEGDHFITVKGVSFEEQTQKFQIMILLNVFLMVYFVQSWIVMASDSNEMSPTSFISIAVLPL
uniref:Uncharacterized protein n=1 Tax=Entamoeba invadens TaxID=33085 RepID=S0B8E6_ENTIV|nr:hypothetical protein [Entamoeba invadens]